MSNAITARLKIFRIFENYFVPTINNYRLLQYNILAKIWKMYYANLCYTKNEGLVDFHHSEKYNEI